MNAKFVGSVLRVASIVTVPIAVMSISATAGAQRGRQRGGQRELFEWRGRVDQEVRVEMQGDRSAVIAMGPREMTGYDNARAMSGVPSTNGYVSVQMRQGRGVADVVQQPSARNGYTTIVRIRDTQSGAGSYDVVAFWQPARNYGYGNSGQYGRYENNGRYGDNGQYGDEGQYDDNGRHGDDGQYGDDGEYGNDGNYGRYGRYPPRVVIQQPVYQPVYGGRRAGGKTLPAPDRGSAYPSDQYPGRGNNERYQRGNAQAGKSLPGDNQGRRSDRSRGDENQQGQSGQSGKALPGTNRSNHQQDGWQREH